jgi:hypothetical protein
MTLFWGIGYATQDTLFKAVVAGMLPEGRGDVISRSACSTPGTALAVGRQHGDRAVVRALSSCGDRLFDRRPAHVTPAVHRCRANASTLPTVRRPQPSGHPMSHSEALSRPTIGDRGNHETNSYY